MYQDPEIAAIIKNLERKKQQSVQGNWPDVRDLDRPSCLSRRRIRPSSKVQTSHSWTSKSTAFKERWILFERSSLQIGERLSRYEVEKRQAIEVGVSSLSISAFDLGGLEWRLRDGSSEKRKDGTSSSWDLQTTSNIESTRYCHGRSSEPDLDVLLRWTFFFFFLPFHSLCLA